MPTKPLVQPEAWATNALYTTGPFIGSASKVVPGAGVAAEGHRPGANFPTAAEHENSQQNRITELARWLFLGTFLPDADAHVVETNTDGRAGLFGLDVENTDDEIAVNVIGTANTFPVMLATGTGGNTVYQADVGTGSGIGYSIALSSGTPTGFLGTLFSTVTAGARAFMVQMSGSPAATYGYRGIADPGTFGDLMRLDHNGNGRAITIQHFGSPSGAAVSVSCFGPGSASAFRGSGTGTAYTVHADSSNTPGGGGVFGDMGNTTGFAVHGRTSAAATSASRAVRAEGRGSAVALEATGANGDAIVASASNIANVAVRLPGKATDPTSTFGGRMDFNTTTGTWVISDQDAATYRDLHATRGGIAIGTSAGGAVITNNNGAVYTLAGTLTLTGQSTPRRAGVRITLSFTCEARSLVGTTNTVDVRITDMTAGVTVAERSGVGTAATDGYFLAVATTSWQRPIVLEVPYTVPAAGDRTFIVEVKTSTANGIQIRDPRLEPYGSYT